MTQAVVAILADTVVEVLNGAEFSQPFTAERAFLPRFELSEMQHLRVTVVPKRISTQAGDRSRSQCEYDIDVAVQQKLPSLDSAAIDDLVALSEEIADHFRSRRPDGYPSAICLRSQIDPVYAQEHLDELRQFTSVITLTFRVWR